MKRIIAVTAAVMSALAVSSNALAFTDMKDTQGSILTQSLGIISGYEDGSFRPDKELTRSEAAAIIVRAIGCSDEDAEEIKKAIYESDREDYRQIYVTEFADFDKDHWANGYIDAGIVNGLISGFEDNTFRYSDTVTEEQVLTMLVNALGYKDYAMAMGGYPQGYIQYANITGIIEDAGADYTKNATRQFMLDSVANALTVPVCVITEYETSWDGRIVPHIEIKDSEGADYQTLLTYRLDVYEADATVNSVDKDSAQITITSAKNFADEYIGDTGSKKTTVKLGKTSVEKDKKYKMYIRIDDFDAKDYTLICAFPQK